MSSLFGILWNSEVYVLKIPDLVIYNHEYFVTEKKGYLPQLKKLSCHFIHEVKKSPYKTKTRVTKKKKFELI